jgi:hypothetical protein
VFYLLLFKKRNLVRYRTDFGTVPTVYVSQLTVFRICDMLVRIRMRIWILGSVPQPNGSGIWMRIFLQPLFESAQHFYQKRKDPEGPKTSGFGTLSLSMCPGAVVPEAAKRGDKHGEGGGERGRGARRVGATGPAGGGAGRAVGLAGQPAGHRRHGQQDILGPAPPLGAGVPQGSYIFFT